MNKLARLEKVDLRDQWKDEAKDFTPWLAEPENIEILSEAIGMELEVIGKEEKVGSFSADILCKDINTNRNVVIENQLEQTDHTHLGQVITYCAGLEASTFIWISSQVREEHRAAVDWLNAITSDDYQFFAIEVQLFRIGDSPVAPNFKIVAKPNGWTKNVRKQVSDELSDTEKLKLEYWEEYRKYVLEQPKEFNPQRPLPQHRTNVAIGTSGIWLSACVGRGKTNIAVDLNIQTSNAKEVFDKLYEAGNEKSKEKIGGNIQWLRMDDKKSSYVSLETKGDYHDRNDWQRQFEWLYETTVKFLKFFKPLIKNVK